MNVFDDPVASKVLKHLISAGRVVSDSMVPAATQ
jgi:hypothetical protein